MPGLHPHVDPEGLLEYSVVFTDRSLNHMSDRFRAIMRGISATLKDVYAADAVAVVPGGGTYAMEAVARQFATGKRCMVLRNGWFTYRWTQIFETCGIPAEATVLKARQVVGAGPEGTRGPVADDPWPDGGGRESGQGQPNAPGGPLPNAAGGTRPHAAGGPLPFAPAPVDEVVAAIAAERPDVVFTAHVETSSGIVLPDAYMRAVAEAVHGVGGLFVVDGVASGAVWLDMAEIGVDVMVTAPQKGWSGSPCAGLVMLGPEGRARTESSSSTTFAADLGMWLKVMDAYVGGGQLYHATMPTDALKFFHDAMLETHDFGFDLARERQWELGRRVRALLADRGFASVAAPGFEAPGVVVSYTDDPAVQNGSRFADAGLQIAAGVPLRCDEPADFRTFRLGLFGLDKLGNVDRTVDTLARALDRVAAAG